MIVSAMKVAMAWYVDENGFRPYAASFIFCIVSLDIYNNLVTAIVALIT
jgi:hypothetical protein